MDSASLINAFVELIAERVVQRLAGTTAQPDRVAVAAAAEHGAPSARWVREQARLGRIMLRGPRGARYVDREELQALLAASTIKRKGGQPIEDGDVRADAAAAVAAMVTERVGAR